jgi:hypothetical protein
VAKIIFLTWVRELEPATSYLLQQAVDPVIDGVCPGGDVGAEWVTVGAGSREQSILTSDLGSAHLPLSRVMQRGQVGATFESQLRIVNASTGAVVLQSNCFQFQVMP